MVFRKPSGSVRVSGHDGPVAIDGRAGAAAEPPCWASHSPVFERLPAMRRVLREANGCKSITNWTMS